MKKVPDNLFHRIELGFGITWQILPGDLTFKEWIFSPECGITWPGKLLNGNTRERDPIRKGNLKIVDNNFYARYFWIHGALRIIGIDVGASIFYKLKDEQDGCEKRI